MLNKINELLSTSEKWVIIDNEGIQHELSEGIAGIPQKLDPTDEIYELLGINPKYITFENLLFLDSTFDSILGMLYTDASYSVKKKFEDYLGTGEVKEKKERKKRGPNKPKAPKEV